MSVIMDRLDTAMNGLRKVVSNNKDSRKVCQMNNDDMLLEKNTLAFLEDVIESFRKLILELIRLYFEQRNLSEIEKNEKLTKEEFIQKLNDEIEKNEKLTKEEKETLKKQLDNEKIKDDTYEINNKKIKDTKEIVKKEMEDGEKNGLSNEEIATNIKNKINSDSIKPNDVMQSTSIKENNTKQSTTSVKEKISQEAQDKSLRLIQK